MAPTKATRPTSTKPTLKITANPAQSPIGRARNRPTIKRALSADGPPSPPPKRNKISETSKSEFNAPNIRKATGRSRAVSKKRPPKSQPQPRTDRLVALVEGAQQPYFNPLPAAPPKTRPAPLLWVWGTGDSGQFGMGTDNLGEVSKPRRNMWVTEKMQEGVFGGVGAGIESIAAGGLHSLFIDETGTVWSCGVNDDAALGRITKVIPDPSEPGKLDEDEELAAIPHPLTSLVDEKFRAIHLCTGDSICAAVSAEGDLRVWGTFRDDHGLLGSSSAAECQFTPAPIQELSHKLSDAEKVSSAAAGNNHLLVLTTHGRIYAWGVGAEGQLGRKVVARRKLAGTVPAKVTLGNRSRKAVLIGAGACHSFAVDDAGDVWGWGLNDWGQVGVGSNKSLVIPPKKVFGLSKDELGGATIVAVEGGHHHTLFLASNGKVFACGRAVDGQLGIPRDHPVFEGRGLVSVGISEPVLVRFPEGDDTVMRISVGERNNAAITEGGALYAWGGGESGQLGLGDESAVWTPQVVCRQSAWTVVDVKCGGQHTLGLFRKNIA